MCVLLKLRISYALVKNKLHNLVITFLIDISITHYLAPVLEDEVFKDA